jgi:hypothetical protein
MVFLGIGMIWQGLLIVWVGGLPLMITARDKPKPLAGTPEAFGYFWIEQYRIIGLLLAIGGSTLALTSVHP